jgi:DNA-binding FadR family transcriptional regulator
MKSESGPAVLKAAAFIRNNLAKGVWQPGDCLPSYVTLAKDARVSPVSLTRAMAILKREGLVSGTQRSRIRVGREETNAPPGQLQDPVWRMKRLALEKDLLMGVFATQDKLPSLKELQIRYGTCFRTMRRILRAMAADGVIQLRGRTYMPLTVATRSYTPRVVFITFRIQALPRSAINQGQYQVLGLFENECIRRGLKPEIMEIDFYDPVETHRMIASPALNRPALGYVLDATWSEGSVFRQSTIDLLMRLAALQRPIAILDEIGTFELPAPFAANLLIQVFRIEGKRAGGRIARLLLEIGHREVAYISSRHLHRYSTERLEGVQEQYSNAGLGDKVHPAVATVPTNHLDQLLDLSGFDDSLIRKVIGVDRTKSQEEDQYRQFLEYRAGKTAGRFTPDDVRVLRNSLAGVSVMARQERVDRKVFDRMCVDVFAQAGARLDGIVLAPLFKRALGFKHATAWICVNDGAALAALAFLRERAIPVPGRISVIGFDNEPVQAFNQRLTTFDFNAVGFVYGMLNFIMRPPRLKPRFSHNPIEVEGIIVQRETVGPPRR